MLNFFLVSVMEKREKFQNFWRTHKGSKFKRTRRVGHIGLFYASSGIFLPVACFAFNETDVAKIFRNPAAVGDRCLPIPKSSVDRFICVVIIGSY